MGRMAVAAIVSLWVIPISIAVNRIVPDPYMDEIFHIPQAQRYCHGDFKTWNPMITTPPGLYYLSLAYLASLFPGMWFAKGIQSFPELCSTAYLRSINAIMAIICSVLVYDLLIILRPCLSGKRATFYAVVIALYPLHWFFTFLYYTDAASLSAVLAMYLASLKKKYMLSALLGAFSTLFRQTNVVWVMFVAANGAITYVEDLCWKDHILVDHKIKFEKKNFGSNKKVVAVAPTLRRRTMGTLSETRELSESGVSNGHLLNDSGFMDEIMEVTLKFWYFKWKVLVTFFPYIIVLVAFLAFVILNGGIVLGAKEAHVVSPHFAQMLYFGLAAALALAPAHFNISQVSNFCRQFWSRKLSSAFQISVSLILGFISVHFFSIAHPYLLADNRHYTFYIWRKVIQAHWSMKYFLVPLYIYSWVFIINMLGKTQRKIWVLLFFIASAMVLIPAPLIELRYYTIPFYLLILNSHVDNIEVVVGFLYASVNVLTMAMFLMRPFHWDHEAGIQRFIW
ncbi:alpha-1,2-glucosyltransferase [Apostasia shenzhenica]|uniref:Dol-P-Glc:Glc(2)Man(9)GlcNAc(2)-PP-Dol alpha-1,2-glucosyltransferase n=1 Tax=Apostasia shenzhenica TaxID=1088818 RepID=A0A2I0B289_9ASPA|nr:alpha-1,2-glucosyltransferase [Apostasia shenzhenica]